MRSASGESYVQSGPLVEGAESHTSHDQQALAPSFDELLFDLLFAASLNTYSHSAKLYNGPQVLGECLLDGTISSVGRCMNGSD